ncbi:DUF5304 domain-containing protein [Streptomyces sp. NPDC002851]
MSDTERPVPDPAETTGPTGAGGAAQSDADAWAEACAEDLAAEQARRRAQYGTPTGSAAEELRKLVDAVADKLAGIQVPMPGGAAQSAVVGDLVNQAVNQAKAAVEPVIERNPEVFDHLAAAGSELLAAYRSAVSGAERRWTREDDKARHRPWDTGRDGDPDSPPDPPRKPEGHGGTEHIDLD